MQKRGQVAAFIIIGIVILILVVGIVGVKKGIFTNLFQKIATTTKAVPQQIRPVQEFIDGCVNKVTTDGISLLAQQGGYITLPSDPIPSTPFTPLGPTLEIIPTSDFRTAVWYRERGNSIQETN